MYVSPTVLFEAMYIYRPSSSLAVLVSVRICIITTRGILLEKSEVHESPNL